MIDDSEFLRRYVAERSQEAFAELVRRHLNLVFRSALRQMSGDAHRAQDVAQTVFTLLSRKAAALTQHTSLVGWLYTTTHNVVRDVRREDRRRQAREREVQTMNELMNDASAEVDWPKLRVELDQAMRSLSVGDREAILLRFFEARSFAEVGRVLNLTEDAARMRVGRALEKLRVGLAKQGVASTAVALGTAMAKEAALAVPAGLAEAVTGAVIAGGGPIAVAGLLTFIGTTKVVFSVAGAAVILAVSAAIFEMEKARAADAALVLEQRAYDALQARMKEAERRNRITGRQQFANFLDSVLQLQAKPSAPSRVQAQSDPEGAGRALLDANPEIKKRLAMEMKAQIAGRYFLLYRELGLNEAQVAAFEEIMTDGPEGSTTMGFENHYMDLGPDGRLIHDSQKTPVMKLVAGAGLTDDETRERLQKLLGEQGYAKYVSGEFATAPPDPRIDIASALYFTDTPLTAEQGRQLARVFKAVGRRFSLPPEEYWQAVSSQSRSFLSEPQLAAFTFSRAQDEFDRSLR